MQHLIGGIKAGSDLPQVLAAEQSLTYVARRGVELRAVAEFHQIRNSWMMVNFVSDSAQADPQLTRSFLRAALQAFFERSGVEEVTLPESSSACALAEELFGVLAKGHKGIRLTAALVG